VHRECLPVFRAALDGGDRKLTRIFKGLETRLLVVDAEVLLPGAERFFANVNTPEELALAEAGE
jgi:molybdopterin-guanine dinucleotide biosynthesis protein A